MNFDGLITHNKLGLYNKDLESKMRELTTFRALELKSNTAFWDFKDFNYTQYKHIHFYIFQDIFEWAGKDRYELGFHGRMSKYMIQFCRGNCLLDYADSIFYGLNDNFMQCEDIPKKLANLWHELNFLHPFREGNGRVSGIFLEMFAKSLRIKFDIDNIERRKQVIALNRAMRNNMQSLEELVLLNTEKLDIIKNS
ncbi:Fic family protein [Helicobacter trogontum]|uniref:protein adenylyltransferase n=1 Tax=Helicobacter trogontum TaxID=50960 RepID=A0A4U8SF88_9HELI|nr:Fic family protein [Helicobacter trogontum]TLD84878.1 hypothetical protein LS81_000450 [Helicobacter trogontum]